MKRLADHKQGFIPGGKGARSGWGKKERRFCEGEKKETNQVPFREEGDGGGRPDKEKQGRFSFLETGRGPEAGFEGKRKKKEGNELDRNIKGLRNGEENP